MTATVIKAGKAGPILKRLSTVDLADHLAEARTVIEGARTQATVITEEARARANQAIVEARERGYADGHEKGYDEGLQAGKQAAQDEVYVRFQDEQARLVEDMKRVIEEFGRWKEGLRIAAERDLLDFALLIARKLTFAIGRLHRESAQENLRRALRLVGTGTDLTIRAHPDDVDVLETYARSLAEAASACPSVRLVADESVSPGGCTVARADSIVDATLEHQVDELVTLLLGEKPVQEDTQADGRQTDGAKDG